MEILLLLLTSNDTSSDTSIFVDFSTLGIWILTLDFNESGSPTVIVTHNGGTTSVNLSSGENLGTFTSVTRI